MGEWAPWGTILTVLGPCMLGGPLLLSAIVPCCCQLLPPELCVPFMEPERTPPPKHACMSLLIGMA